MSLPRPDCLVFYSSFFGCRWVSLFFFFKQKTAYEMRISDWSSDVCSSDLASGADTSPAAIAPAAAPTLIVTFGLLRAEGPGQALRHSPLDPGSRSLALAWPG